MADRYVNYDKLLEERHRLGLDEMSKIHKVNAFNHFIDSLPTADVVEAEKYNELREAFIEFACSGVNNLAPYCKNRCVECVDERGWCRYGSSCKGFNPDGEGSNT